MSNESQKHLSVNRIGGVMVFVLASSVVDRGLEPYSVRKYVIQSVTTGAVKSVFRHEICEVSISSAFSKLTEETIFNFEKDSQSDDEMLEVDIPEPVMKKPRFKQAVIEDDIQSLAKARTEPKTNQQTNWLNGRSLRIKLKIHHPNICPLRMKHAKIFSCSDWLIENGQDSNFENLDDASLNEKSCYFYASLQTKDGNDYSKSALVGIRVAVSRHLFN